MDDAPFPAPAPDAQAPAGDHPPDAAPGFEAEVSSLRHNGSPLRAAELGGPRLSRRQRLVRVGGLVALVAAALLALTAPVYGPSLRALLTPHAPPLTLYDTGSGRALGTLTPVRDAGQLVAGGDDLLR